MLLCPWFSSSCHLAGEEGPSSDGLMRLKRSKLCHAFQWFFKYSTRLQEMFLCLILTFCWLSSWSGSMVLSDLLLFVIDGSWLCLKHGVGSSM